MKSMALLQFVKSFSPTWIFFHIGDLSDNLKKHILWLMQVYKNTSNLDKYLIKSIKRPAADPNAGEVYYRSAHKSVNKITIG